MSKSFEKQIKILQKDCGMSEKQAKEAIIAYNAFDENNEGKFIVSSDFAWLIEYYKTKKGFDELKEISVRKIKTCFELQYTLFSNQYNETVDFFIVVKNKNQSIAHLFHNASALEEELDEKFDILFYDFF